MQITKTAADGVDVFTIQGQLDGTTSPQLESELLGPVQADAPRVILDLEHVALVSSAALRVLLANARRMKKHGGRILLCALQPQVKQVFEISALTAFFDFHPDVKSALATGKGEVPAPPAPASAAPPVPDLKPSVPAAPVGSVVTTQNPTPEVQAKPASAPDHPVQVEPPPLAPPLSPPQETVADLYETLVAPSSHAPALQAVPPAVPAPSEAVVPVTPAKVAGASTGLATSSGKAVALPDAKPILPPPVLFPATPAPVSSSPSAAAPAHRVPTGEAANLPATSAAGNKEKSPATSLPPPSDLGRPRSKSVVPTLVWIIVLVVLLVLGVYFLKPGKPETQKIAEATPTPRPSPEIEVLPATPRASEPAATPSPTPAIVSATVAPATPIPVTPTAQTTLPAGTENNVATAAGPFDFNRSSPENQAVSQAVLQRIDAMPLSEKDKTKLYTALDRAQGLGKLVTVNFSSNRTELVPADITNLNAALHLPKVQHFLDDPTVVLVVLGFADTKGSSRINKEVSERRARKVVDALRGPCAVGNVIHTIGMGGQDIAGESLDKNRVVEVWAVLP